METVGDSVHVLGGGAGGPLVVYRVYPLQSSPDDWTIVSHILRGLTDLETGARAISNQFTRFSWNFFLYPIIMSFIFI